MKYQVTISYQGFTTYIVEAPNKIVAKTLATEKYEKYENGNPGDCPVRDSEEITHIHTEKLSEA